MTYIPLVSHIEPLLHNKKMIISDVWGVIHNGMVAWNCAYTALSNARKAGIPVVLVTNAPRPSPIIIGQLDKLGVPRHSYDYIISSGDLTLQLIEKRQGETCYHIGPERDLTLFEGLNVPLTALEKAEYVVCTGLFNDETEKPEDYLPSLKIMLAKNLTLICANPDKVVERGSKLIYCAGAIADLYIELGGKVIFAGKPYAPIYEAAKTVGEKLRGEAIQPSQILCIGDALRTDVKGANDFGADCLFTIEGIHGHEIIHNGAINREAMQQLFVKANARANAAMPQLSW